MVSFAIRASLFIAEYHLAIYVWISYGHFFLLISEHPLDLQ